MPTSSSAGLVTAPNAISSAIPIRQKRSPLPTSRSSDPPNLEGAPAMMGIKARTFGPLPPVSLDELVPHDHFYRQLERTLDLGFVRELVGEAYAGIGRPSVDPVVFFKLQLILFFEGLRSERQLMRV